MSPRLARHDDPRLIWVKAFTDRPTGGGPCAVIFDSVDVAAETRIAPDRETRLSEGAFLVGSERADFGARLRLRQR